LAPFQDAHGPDADAISERVLAPSRRLALTVWVAPEREAAEFKIASAFGLALRRAALWPRNVAGDGLELCS